MKNTHLLHSPQFHTNFSNTIPSLLLNQLILCPFYLRLNSRLWMNRQQHWIISVLKHHWRVSHQLLVHMYYHKSSVVSWFRHHRSDASDYTAIPKPKHHQKKWQAQVKIFILTTMISEHILISHYLHHRTSRSVIPIQSNCCVVANIKM